MNRMKKNGYVSTTAIDTSKIKAGLYKTTFKCQKVWVIDLINILIH